LLFKRFFVCSQFYVRLNKKILLSLGINNNVAKKANEIDWKRKCMHRQFFWDLKLHQCCRYVKCAHSL